MDPNLLKNIDFFAAPNNQTTSSSNQNAESSATAAARSAPSDADLWEAAGLAAQSGPSEDVSTGPSASFAQSSTAPTNLAFGSLSASSQLGQMRTSVPSRPAQAGANARKRDAHQRKRAKVDSEAAALESVDYWIQFDDDDDNKGGSFEIDYSKQRNNAAANLRRSLNSVNTMATTPGLGTGLYTNSGLKSDDIVDDSALDNALSDDDDAFDSINLPDELSKIGSMAPADVPPREGLYSTPLSWEKPQPGIRMDPLLGLGAGPILSEAEQRRLLAIALNTGRTSSGFGSGFTFGYGGPLNAGFPFSIGGGNLLLDAGLGTTSLSQISKIPESPQSRSQDLDEGAALAKEPKRPQVSRTNTGSTEKGKEKAKAGDRTAHNDIERKYRTNLKDRISELRDAVPALRAIPEEGDDDDESSQAQRAPKVSKGTVLTKATEYIHYLERRNKAITKEHQELNKRLQAFEQLLNATARQPFPMPSYSRTLFDPRGFC